MSDFCNSGARTYILLVDKLLFVPNTFDRIPVFYSIDFLDTKPRLKYCSSLHCSYRLGRR